MEHSNKLGSQSIGKLLFEFSIPAIIGMLVNSLYIVIDRIFIGRVVGGMAISGVSLTFPIGIIIMGFGMLVGIGASTRISIKLGEKNKEESEKILGNAFTLLIIVSLLVTVFGLVFINPLLKAFGASTNTLGYAKEFIIIILCGSVLQNLGFGLNNVIRAEGNPKKAMVTMLIGAVVNIVLDYIFIYILHWGIKGAATATVIAQGVNTIWVLSYFLGKNSMLKLKSKNFKLKKEIVIGIFSIGMSPFAMQIAASIVNIILNKSLATHGGDLAIGALGIINGITTMILMPIFGINQGCQPIIGFNYGAKQYNRVKKALKLSALAATVISTLGAIAVYVLPELLVGMFNKSDAQLTAITVHGIKIFMIMFPVIGFQIVSSNLFQAVGKAKIAIFLSLLRQVIVLIPMILLLPSIFKLDGVWMASPISDFISSIVTAIFLFKEIKKLDDKNTSHINNDICTKLQNA